MKVLRFKDRDIVKVQYNDIALYVQPFYRSTGRNSNKWGVFFPFDGLRETYPCPDWFDKHRFMVGGKYSTDPLNQYGTQRFKELSEALGRLKIPEGKESTIQEINTWLFSDKEISRKWITDYRLCLPSGIVLAWR